MILWIDRTLALAIHERQLSEHGGSNGVRDEALLESALARPQQQLDSLPCLRGRVGVGAIAALAASLAFGLARNHPFVDGNKRTAHVCYRVFLMLNDVELTADAQNKCISMLSLADGSLSESDFADWLRANLKTCSDQKVQEPRRAFRRQG